MGPRAGGWGGRGWEAVRVRRVLEGAAVASVNAGGGEGLGFRRGCTRIALRFGDDSLVLGPTPQQSCGSPSHPTHFCGQCSCVGAINSSARLARTDVILLLYATIPVSRICQDNSWQHLYQPCVARQVSYSVSRWFGVHLCLVLLDVAAGSLRPFNQTSAAETGL